MTSRTLFYRCIDCGCRTHRERKEQYVRMLECEVARLREVYGHDISAANVSLQQNQQRIQSLGEENEMLKRILSAHGIPFEADLADLERQRAERALPGQQSSPFSNHTPSTQVSPGSHPFTTTTPPTTISSNTVSPHSISPPVNGIAPPPQMNISPTQAYSTEVHQLSSHSNGVAMDSLDRSGHVSAEPVQAMGGIFETDPQLQIDFVLTCVNLTPASYLQLLTYRTDWKAPAENTPIFSAADP